MKRQTASQSLQSTITTGETSVSLWRARAIAFLVQWQPDFVSSFSDQIKSAQQGQPAGVQSWIGFWAIPEGFGGPYKPGDSTDIGTAILYALMFAVLFTIAAGRYYGVDRSLTPRLGALGFLASGRFGRQTTG